VEASSGGSRGGVALQEGRDAVEMKSSSEGGVGEIAARNFCRAEAPRADRLLNSRGRRG